MSDRPIARPKRPRAINRPSSHDAAESGVPAGTGGEIAGVVSAAAATRSGDDVRRRGWFWHWNSIVTQYAPLIGLKGVGLLNSYTVWTDRREESPHRGFAFPSQQSEADFYGEDRAELITINKLLVALDLIEIRKEMVLRTDEQGRRWKVPHNFYRVKDHGDGAGLTSKDVLAVAELADRDRAVYRYTRRVFSPRFAPIDRDNIWVSILSEVRPSAVWQRLAERTAREEQRASERTRAGHAARKGGFFVPDHGDTPASATTVNDSAAAANRTGRGTSVAPINTGLAIADDESNTGFDANSSTIVEPANGGGATAVGPSNRTYNEFVLTTTTTTESAKTAEHDAAPNRTKGAVDRDFGGSQRAVTPPKLAVTGVAGAGPAAEAPSDLPGEQRAIRAFEDANGRAASPAERQLLRGLAERFEPAARAARVPDHESGWRWLAAAVYEAVEAGSVFVAPRRLREILTRWEREGFPAAGASASREAVATSPARGQATAPEGYRLGEGDDFALPHGFGSRRTWAFAVMLLGTVIARERLAELVEGTAIAGYANGEVSIAVPNAEQARRLTGEYGEVVARKLGEAMRRPVRIAAIVPAGEFTTREEPVAPAVLTGSPARATNAEVEASEAEWSEPSFIVPECGLPSAQVWAAVLEEVAAAGEVSRANIDLWLRATRLLGRESDGCLIVGAMHAVAQQRIATRFAAPLRAAVNAVLGAPAALEIVVTREWLRARATRPERDQRAGAA